MPTLTETQEKKFKQFFPLLLIVLMLIANAIVHTFHLKYGFLVFLGNIMYFTMAMASMDFKKKLLDVFFGGLVGLLLSYAMIMTIVFLSSNGMPELLAFLLPLAVVLFLLIYMHSKAPMFLNNVGFAYMVASTAQGETFITDFPEFLVTFAVGNTILNILSFLLLGAVMKYVVKNVE